MLRIEAEECLPVFLHEQVDSKGQDSLVVATGRGSELKNAAERAPTLLIAPREQFVAEEPPSDFVER
jgi:hypothetical protein